MELLFKTNIEIYSLEIDVTEEVRAVKHRSSALRFPDTINLNLYNDHFSLVTNLGAYSNSWSCAKCDQLFTKVRKTVHHKRNCSAKSKLVFPGDGYGSRMSIFEQLLHLGIQAAPELQFFPYRISYDFECYFEVQDISAGKAESVLSNLVPASVTVCSNVPGYETPVCFVFRG